MVKEATEEDYHKFVDKNKFLPRHKCGDCGVSEGQYHILYCEMERCPFCLGQVLSCGCSAYDNLEHLDADVNEYNKKILEILEKKGRIPYIYYPHLCAKCRKPWPEFFHVSDDIWKKYIEPDMQGQIICEECFFTIRLFIDNGKED